MAYDLFRGLLKAGIWIATQTPERVYKREASGLMDLMEPIWLMYLAHMESLKKSERLTAKWDTRRKKAREQGTPYGKRCPEWLELTKTGYALRPGPAATIRTIFRQAREGLGIHRLAAWLNERREEHPPFGKSGRWLRPYVRKILRGRAVLGEYQPRSGRGKANAPNGNPIPNFYPPVLSDDEWRLAQAALDGRRRKAGRPGNVEANLFTGLVYEATTRLRMSIDGRASGRPGRIHRYLVAYQQGPCCRSGKGVPYIVFEDAVLDVLFELHTIDVVPSPADADARESRVQELTERVHTLAGEVEKLGARPKTRSTPESWPSWKWARRGLNSRWKRPPPNATGLPSRAAPAAARRCTRRSPSSTRCARRRREVPSRPPCAAASRLASGCSWRKSGCTASPSTSGPTSATCGFTCAAGTGNTPGRYPRKDSPAPAPSTVGTSARAKYPTLQHTP